MKIGKAITNISKNGHTLVDLIEFTKSKNCKLIKEYIKDDITTLSTIEPKKSSFLSAEVSLFSGRVNARAIIITLIGAFTKNK